MASVTTGPRRLDPFQLAKLKSSSIQQYQRALLPFVAYLVEHDFVPVGREQWDDLVVEWRNDSQPSKAAFESCVAAIEFVFPRFRPLVWARSVISGWSVVHQTRHTVPLGLGAACLIAAILSPDHPRLGLGIVLQRLLGLRPSELLNIQSRDVSLPEHVPGSLEVCTVGLGIRTGTKAKRAQAVILRDVVGIGLMRWLVHETPHDDVLIPYTYEQYRRLLMRTERGLGLELGWTPHSPRSGFASELTAAGVAFSELRERGRWVADSSLRTYVDLVSSANIAVTFRLSGLSSAIAYAQANFLYFFPGARIFCTEALRDGVEGFVQGTRRQDASALGSGLGAEACGLPLAIEEAAEGQGRLSAVGHDDLCREAGAVGGKEAGVQPLPARRGAASSSSSALAQRSHQAPSLVVGGRGRGRGHQRQ